MFRPRSKIIAIFLLLVFTQKLGLRLWMHHWFHESRVARSHSDPSSEKLQLECNCFDDAMMPLVESEVFTVQAPATTYITLTTAPLTPIPARDEVYYSLKGPPTCPS
jgi:hypothetical protein